MLTWSILFNFYHNLLLLHCVTHLHMDGLNIGGLYIKVYNIFIIHILVNKICCIIYIYVWTQFWECNSWKVFIVIFCSSLTLNLTYLDHPSDPTGETVLHLHCLHHSALLPLTHPERWTWVLKGQSVLTCLPERWRGPSPPQAWGTGLPYSCPQEPWGGKQLSKREGFSIQVNLTTQI